MLTVLLLILLVPLLLSRSLYSNTPNTTDTINPEGKILILSSNGGYGHMAAANTLKSILSKKYEIKVIYPIDQLRIWGVRSGEQVYNSMLQYGWIRSMNAITKYIAPRIFKTRKNKIEELVSRHIELEKPDIVISLIPYVNFPASEAARKNGVPFLLITTDNDLRNWVHGLHKVTHPNFRVTIGSDLPSTRDMLKQRKIADKCIDTIGLPLRPDFKTTKSLSELYAQYQVPTDKPVVLIMMGGAGAQSAWSYARKVGRSDLEVHLIVVAGKNNKLAKQLKKLKLHPSNSITVMGFTDKISDLMALSDIVITKPGPGTINEALSMQLPVLIDNTNTSLSWEQANIDLVVRYGVGERINRYRDAKDVLRKYLKDPDCKKNIEEAFSLLPPNLFQERIPDIIDSMLVKPQTRNIVEISAQSL